MDTDAASLGRLKPSHKVTICIDMSDVCVRTCAEAIRQQNPGISDEELVKKLQERLEWAKHPREHEE